MHSKQHNGLQGWKGLRKEDAKSELSPPTLFLSDMEAEFRK